MLKNEINRLCRFFVADCLRHHPDMLKPGLFKEADLSEDSRKMVKRTKIFGLILYVLMFVYGVSLVKRDLFWGLFLIALSIILGISNILAEKNKNRM